MALQDKILAAFGGKVVRKDLAFQVKGNLPVPTYVLEYLLGQYCASDDPQIIAEGVEKVKPLSVTITSAGLKPTLSKDAFANEGRTR